MSLKLSLMLRVAFLSGIWLMAAFSFLLVRSDRDAAHRAAEAAEFVGRELELQLLLRGGPGPDFPDMRILSGTYPEPGMCVAYEPAGGPAGGGAAQRFCGGGGGTAAPSWFSALYLLAFEPGRETERRVSYRETRLGSVLVSLDGATVVAEAWRETGGLLALSLVTVLGLLALVHAAAAQALRPVREILAGMNRLAEGDLSTRLPAFRVTEFDRIGMVFNHLAGNLQETIAQRRALTERLVAVQDEERRHLARELHDEFGQCLAAVAAIAASIGQTAEAECPSILEESRSLGRIAARMMDSLRGALTRLRPPGIDELGLAESLGELVASWNGGRHGKPRFVLETEGDTGSLPSGVQVDLYRIVQECLTNAIRHADASLILIRLAREASPPAVELSVTDDGRTAEVDFEHGSGRGIPGIRERVAALAGEVVFRKDEAGGVAVRVRIPLPRAAETTV